MPLLRLLSTPLLALAIAALPSPSLQPLAPDAVAAAGLVDAWTTVHPHHPGFTFDPVKNPLAAIMSRTGRAARFDRVLLRSPARAVAPSTIATWKGLVSAGGTNPT